MPVLHNIPPKGNTIPTGNVKLPLDPSRKQHPANGFEGFSYNSPFTEGAFTNVQHHNNATIVQLPRLQVEEPGQVVRGNDFVKVTPQSKTILAHPGRSARTPIVKRVGGPSPTSNTPFHPKPQPIAPRAPRHPVASTEKAVTAAAVATSQTYTKKGVPVPGAAVEPIGSFLHVSGRTLSSHSNLDQGVSRWQTVKVGAAG